MVIKERFCTMTGGKQVKFRRMARSTRRHWITLKGMAAKAFRHGRKVLSAPQCNLVHTVVTGETEFPGELGISLVNRCARTETFEEPGTGEVSPVVEYQAWDWLLQALQALNC